VDRSVGAGTFVVGLSDVSEARARIPASGQRRAPRPGLPGVRGSLRNSRKLSGYTFGLSNATVYLGKGVGGIRRFRTFDGTLRQIDGEAKFATMDGPNSERAIFDFKGILDGRGKGRLHLKEAPNEETGIATSTSPSWLPTSRSSPA
jgi:hypothetical protein